MPCLAVLTQIRLLGHGKQRLALRAAFFAVREGRRGAVADLPITDGSLSDIDKKGDTSGQDPNEGAGEPALAGVEGGEEAGAEARAGVDGARAERIFDLEGLSVFLVVVYTKLRYILGNYTKSCSQSMVV